MLYVVGEVTGVIQLDDIVYVVHMLYVVGSVSGVTQLDDIVYVVCRDPSIIKTFTDTLSPLADIHVDRMARPRDIVASRYDRQLYVADLRSIWRVSVDHQSSYVKWLTTESSTDTFRVDTLSVTSQGLLVTSRDPPHLREYSMSDKRLLRVVKMPAYVKELLHGVETARGTFVICHQGTSQDEERYPVSEPFTVDV